MAKQILLWLALALACFVPASALTPSAPENRIWEISSIGYDAASTEVTDLGNRTETSTSNYDSAPIHSTATEKIPTEANRSLFGQNAEFKAAEGTTDLVSTGNLGGTLASPSQLSDLGEYLGQNGISLKVGDEFLPEGANGGFSAGGQTVVLGSNPTNYEALHESLHAEQYLDLGPEAYSAQTTAQKEQYVFDRLSNTPEFWDSLNFEEQQHAIWYVQKSGGFR